MRRPERTARAARSARAARAPIPETGAPGTPCSATRDCAGGNFCDGLTGVCTMGGGLDTGAACTSDRQCRPPLRCSLTGSTARAPTAAHVDMGGACHGDRRLPLGPLVRRRTTSAPRCKTAFPPFAGATCADEGAFRGYFEVPRPGKPPADFFRLPFPNDVARHRRARSTSPTSPSRDRRRWASTSCSSTSTRGPPTSTASRPPPAITFRFSGNIDYATRDRRRRADDRRDGGTDASAPSSRAAGSRNNGRTKYSCNHTLVVRNTADTPFEPGHTYAAFVTTGLKSDTGAPAAARRRLHRGAGRDAARRTPRSATPGTPTSRCATG